MDAELFDYTKFCRFCAWRDENNVANIFDEKEDFEIKIRTCLPHLKIDKNDALPKLICAKCSHYLSVFYDFWKSSLKAEKLLTKYAESAWNCSIVDSTTSIETVIEIKEEVEHNYPEGITNSPIRPSALEDQAGEQIEPYMELSVQPGTSSNLYHDKQTRNTVWGTSSREFLQGVENRNDIESDLVVCQICDMTCSAHTYRDHMKEHDSNHFSEHNFNKRKYSSKVFVENLEFSQAKKHHNDILSNNESNTVDSERSLVCPELSVEEADESNYVDANEESYSDIEAHMCYRCDICQQEFSNGIDLHQHMECHKNLYTCSLCGTSFPTFEMTMSHACEEPHDMDIKPLKKLQVCIKEKIYKCKLCPKVFGQLPDLLKHCQEHLTVLATTELNSQEFEDGTGSHLNDISYMKPDKRRKNWPCHICQKSLQSLPSLRKHVSFHTRKLCRCDVCNKPFTSKIGLISHRRHAHGETAVKCGNCRVVTTNCEKHIHDHHKKIKKCEVCSKTFLYQGGYVFDMLKHLAVFT